MFTNIELNSNILRKNPLDVSKLHSSDSKTGSAEYVFCVRDLLCSRNTTSAEDSSPVHISPCDDKWIVFVECNVGGAKKSLMLPIYGITQTRAALKKIL